MYSFLAGSKPPRGAFPRRQEVSEGLAAPGTVGGHRSKSEGRKGRVVELGGTSVRLAGRAASRGYAKQPAKQTLEHHALCGGHLVAGRLFASGVSHLAQVLAFELAESDAILAVGDVEVEDGPDGVRQLVSPGKRAITLVRRS
jgi:hypothetical protein